MGAYAYHTRHLGISFSRDPHLVTYADASYGPICQLGYLSVLGGPIDWASQKSNTVPTSTNHAELTALAAGYKSSSRIRNLCTEINHTLPCVPRLVSDNLGVCNVLENGNLSHKLRHVEISQLSILDACRKDRIKLSWIDTKSQLADPMTKPVSEAQIIFLLNFFNSKVQRKT